MNDIFSDYQSAHNAAVERARQYQCDVGLENAGPLYGKGKFRIFLLPRPENRQGSELRCQVVRSDDPIAIRLV